MNLFRRLPIDPETATRARAAATRQIPRIRSLILLALIFATGPRIVSAEDIRIEAALLTLIEHADLSVQQAGPLVQREISEGTTVESGTILGKIDANEADLNLARTRMELAIADSLATNDIKVRFARKAHEVAVAELKRSLESVERFSKSISQTELDRLKLVADKAELEIEQAQIDLQQADLSRQLKANEVARATLVLERHFIKAPFPGMVVQWRKQRGEWVEPGTPVVRLIRLNRLRAEAFVLSQGLPGDLVGSPVTFRVDGKSIPGKLTFVDPEIDPVNNQVRVVAEIVNSDLLLRPGQSGSLTIHAARAVEAAR